MVDLDRSGGQRTSNALGKFSLEALVDRWRRQRLVLSTYMGLNSDSVGPGAIDAAEVRRERDRLCLPEPATLVAAWPTPIAESVQSLIDESPESGFRRVHRLIDAFEVLAKFSSVVTLSQLVRGPHLPDPLCRLLVQSLRLPSLGHWLDFGRLAANALGTNPGEAIVPELIQFHTGDLSGPRGQGLIALRNRYAHGATPDETECCHDFDEGLQRYCGLLLAAEFLTRYDLIVKTPEGAKRAMGLLAQAAKVDLPANDGSTWIRVPSTGALLEVSPLLAYRRCGHMLRGGAACHAWKLVFFNDLKKEDAPTLLHYRSAHVGRDSASAQAIRDIFPLATWSKTLGGDDFRNLISEHTASFVGRESEIDEILTWVMRRTRGFLVVRGPPGVGKTSLLATVADTELADVDRIYYFAKAGSHTVPEDFLRRLLKATGEKYGRVSIPVGIEEMRAGLREQLAKASRALDATGRKLLIIVDGLDETLAPDQPTLAGTIMDMIPREVPERVLVLLGTRPVPAMDTLFDQLDRERTHSLDLQGLSSAQVRALLSLATSKYDLTPAYVEAVRARSGGNPLYVRMLVEEIIEGHAIGNDATSLPKSLKNVFEGILVRMTRHNAGIPELLYCLALSAEPLTTERVAAVTGLPFGQVAAGLSDAAEVLSWQLGRDDRRCYFLFHAFFADFLLQHPVHCGLEVSIREGFLWAAAREASRDLSLVPEPNMRALYCALWSKDPVPPGLCLVAVAAVDGAKSLLTAQRILLGAITTRDVTVDRALFEALASAAGNAATHVASRWLVASAHRSPESALALVEWLVPIGGLTTAVKLDVRLARANVAVAAGAGCVAGNLGPDLLVRVAESLFDSPDASLRTLGIIATCRLARTNRQEALDVMGRLGAKSVRWGLPRIAAAEMFIGTSLGLLFENVGDKALKGQLRVLAGNLLSRLVVVSPLAWLAPPLAARLLAGVPDDYNSVNLMEMTLFKRELTSQPELASSAAKLAAYVDPTFGSAAEFNATLLSYRESLLLHKSANAVLAPHVVTLSRFLAGEEEALEASWRLWESLCDTDNGMCQDFVYQLRLVQVALKIRGRPPLDARWTERARTAMRHFFVKRYARFRGCHEYRGGALLCGFAFLANQTGSGEEPLAEEFVAHALGQPTTPGKRDARLDAILLRVFEVDAIEYGTYDTAARAVALYGLQRFLARQHALDDYAWGRIATIAARANSYYPVDIEDFLSSLPPLVGQELRAGMDGLTVAEGMGALLSMRSENFLAYAYSEPADSPIRAQMVNILNALVRPGALSGTLRSLINGVIKVVIHGGNI